MPTISKTCFSFIFFKIQSVRLNGDKITVQNNKEIYMITTLRGKEKNCYVKPEKKNINFGPTLWEF